MGTGNVDAQLDYFNARWYDADTGRFITEDPIRDGLMWFTYCNNNPMKFVDKNGLKPGDPFDSIESAAIDFANTFNARSVDENREYGSSIYKSGDNQYTYSEPSTSNSTLEVEPSSPNGEKSVSTIHSHGAPAGPGFTGGNEFSPDDIARIKQNNLDDFFDAMLEGTEHKPRTEYLITPDGTLLSYTAGDIGSAEEVEPNVVGKGFPTDYDDSPYVPKKEEEHDDDDDDESNDDKGNTGNGNQNDPSDDPDNSVNPDDEKR